MEISLPVNYIMDSQIQNFTVQKCEFQYKTNANFEFRGENNQNFPLRGALERENIDFCSILGEIPKKITIWKNP